MFKGITVILLEEKIIGTDPFGAPIIEPKEVEVPNVLVSPTSSDDITNAMNLTGRKAVYTLAIPKGDNHDWENKRVIFFDEEWKSFGIPQEGIDDLIPLKWNKKVMVERYE